MLRQGHAVTLYCYERPVDVPFGVEVADADDVLPASRIIRHVSGSVALFSNLFRLEAQRRGLGTWVDCDMYLVAPLNETSDYLLGESAPGEIESAVLRIPAEDPLLDVLVEPFAQGSVPVWLTGTARIRAALRLLLTGRTDVTRMPWGTLGPHALSWAVRDAGPESRISNAVQPPHLFYPAHWRNAAWVFDPAQRLEDHVGPGTVAIHLWNECLNRRGCAPLPPGSFMARLIEEGHRAPGALS